MFVVIVKSIIFICCFFGSLLASVIDPSGDLGWHPYDFTYLIHDLQTSTALVWVATVLMIALAAYLELLQCIAAYNALRIFLGIPDVLEGRALWRFDSAMQRIPARFRASRFTRANVLCCLLCRERHLAVCGVVRRVRLRSIPRSADEEGEGGAAAADDTPPAKGDVVEGNFRGRGRWMAAEILGWHQDRGAYNLLYDNGEEERDVESKNVRAITYTYVGQPFHSTLAKVIEFRPSDNGDPAEDIYVVRTPGHQWFYPEAALPASDAVEEDVPYTRKCKERPPLVRFSGSELRDVQDAPPLGWEPRGASIGTTVFWEIVATFWGVSCLIAIRLVFYVCVGALGADFNVWIIWSPTLFYSDFS